MKTIFYLGGVFLAFFLWANTVPCAFAQNPSTGSISGTVWKDANNNGQRDAGELGVGGVRISIYRRNDVSFKDYATTNTDGTYKLANLTKGQYALKIVRYYLPDNCEVSLTVSGPNVPNSIDNDFSFGGQTQLMTVNTDSAVVDITAIDAALVYRPTPVWGSVEGTFWYDKNDNGIREGDEQGVEGVVVEIGSMNYGGYFAYDTTDANGRYGFSRLPSLYFDVRIVDSSIPDSLRVSSKLKVRTGGGNETNDSDFSVNSQFAPFRIPFNNPGENVKFVDGALTKHPMGAKQYDLALTRSISKKLLMLGDTFSYTIQVRNEGRATAHQVKVTDHVSDRTNQSYEYVDSYIPGGVEGYYFYDWTPGTLYPGAALEFKFTAKTIRSGVWYNVAEITQMAEKDEDSTPDNNVASEDDIAAMCYSVPYLFKQGENRMATFQLPPQFSGVVWQRKAPDGTLSQAGTGNTLQVTENEVGTYEYTFTFTDGTCPADGCCPGYVIVQESCPKSLCIPMTVSRVKL